MAPAACPTLTARLFGQRLSERLGQPFVVRTIRPGAGSNRGTEAVVRAPADGYTLLAIAGANYINPLLYDKLNFNFVRDIVPIASYGRAPLIVSLHPSISGQFDSANSSLTPAPTREC